VAETPRMGRTGINLLGRAALAGTRQIRRGATLAAAPVLAPLATATAGLVGSPLGLATGGVIGLAKSIRTTLSSVLKELQEQRKITEKAVRQQKTERNKEVSQRLEDVREGKEGDEDPDSGKGTITSRLGKVLKRINAKAKSSAKGLFSKIPGSSFLSGIAGKFAGSLAGMSATFIVGWAAAIAIGALILKFIIDNISDWFKIGGIKLARIVDSVLNNSLGWLYKDNLIEKAMLGQDVNTAVMTAQKKAENQIKAEYEATRDQDEPDFDITKFQKEINQRTKELLDKDKLREDSLYFGYNEKLVDEAIRNIDKNIASESKRKVTTVKAQEKITKTGQGTKKTLTVASILQKSEKDLAKLGPQKITDLISSFRAKIKDPEAKKRFGSGVTKSLKQAITKLQKANKLASSVTPTSGTGSLTDGTHKQALIVGGVKHDSNASSNVTGVFSFGVGNPNDPTETFNFNVASSNG